MVKSFLLFDTSLKLLDSFLLTQLLQGRGADGKEFFHNGKCGGTQLYRPLSKINEKEDSQTIVSTIQRIEEEIKDMTDTVVVKKGKTVHVKHTLLLTMLDGKGR